MQDNTDWQAQYDALIEAGTAKSTRRAYSRDIRYFWAWAELALGQTVKYPAPEELVIRFIIEHINGLSADVEQVLLKEGLRLKPGPLKITTLRRFMSSISVAHQEAGHESPTRATKVKLLLRRARVAKANDRPNKKAAITKDILHAILNTCDDTLHGVRDRALLCLGFASGGRRRSEIANIQIEDLQKIEGGYLIHLRQTKTDQVGKGKTVPVQGMAAQALMAWLVKSGLRKGHLFRGIYPDGSFTKGIGHCTINRIVKRRIQLAGLDPDRYGAHSLRSGFMTEAARNGAPLGDAMALSGHANRDVAGGYYREADIMLNSAAQLLGE